MLVAAQLPAWRQLFDRLVDRCRATQESFATYLSCGVVAAGFGSSRSALAAYPEYTALVERLDRYLAAVPGAHRRALAVTALARVCMQTPVLTNVIEAWPDAITIGALRRLDVPDERFEHLLRERGGLPGTAVAAADRSVIEQFGGASLAADLAGGNAALDDGFDAAWERWEEAVFAGFADRLADAGASVLSSNGHLAVGAQLAALVSRAEPTLRLRRSIPRGQR